MHVIREGVKGTSRAVSDKSLPLLMPSGKQILKTNSIVWGTEERIFRYLIR